MKLKKLKGNGTKTIDGDTITYSWPLSSAIYYFPKTDELYIALLYIGDKTRLYSQGKLETAYYIGDLY